MLLQMLQSLIPGPAEALKERLGGKLASQTGVQEGAHVADAMPHSKANAPKAFSLDGVMILR